MSDIYIIQYRSFLELRGPVWNSARTKEEVHDVERVQSTFLHIVLGLKYSSYEHALGLASLETLPSRRHTICERFALKAARHPKHQHWFQPSNPNAPNTRSHKLEYKQPLVRLSRFKKSPIPYLTSLLNNKVRKDMIQHENTMHNTKCTMMMESKENDTLPSYVCAFALHCLSLSQ